MQEHPDGQFLPLGIETRLEAERLQQFPEGLLLQRPGIHLKVREEVEEGFSSFGVRPPRQCPIRGFQLALFSRLHPREFAKATSNLLRRLAVGILSLDVGHLPSNPELKVLDELSYLLDLVVFRVSFRVGCLKRFPQELCTLTAEHVSLEELDDALHRHVLPQIHGPWVLPEPHAGGASVLLAHVVGRAPTVITVHAQAAHATPKKRPE